MSSNIGIARRRPGQRRSTMMIMGDGERALQSVSTREELLPLAQAYAADNPAFDKMAHLLKHEDYKDLNFGKLLQLIFDSGVTFQELAMSYQSFQHAKAGMIRSFRIPSIMDNLTLDANPRLKNCRVCKGTGGPKDAPCKRCDGTGKVERRADRHARKMVLESAGMLGEGRGPLVNLNMNNVPMPDMEKAMIEAAKVIQQPKQLTEAPIEIASVPAEGNREATEANR